MVLFPCSRTSHVWIAISLTSTILFLPQMLEGFQLHVQQPAVGQGRDRRNIVSLTKNHERCIAPAGNTNNNKPISSARRSSAVFRLYNKLWDRMEIEEDIEPNWYLINCVAGLEMDLLKQCRERCKDMPDAIKFVVPTETKTRSHGANRMVTETKVKYLGYVFAKLRLCPQVYEGIQSLDLCRSWMGTINRQGNKKLPPHPVSLNELEVENFGLEDLEFEEEEVEYLPGGEKEVILDEPGADSKNEIDQEALKAFLGLKVEDMVKVTKPCKFYNEDGIVRRLKEGKILVRFYTYGTMYEEWMEPGDVRKLNDVEVLKGLSGPTQPITQRDLDGPTQATTNRRHEARSFGGELMSNVKGARGPRNRRQDRMERGQTNRRHFGGGGGGGGATTPNDERNREQRNWDWYKENRRSNDGVVADDEWTYRPGSGPSVDDDEAQWGRSPSKRQQRRDRKGEQQQNRKKDDWSAFVTPASAPAEDDFFSSLMTDLSKDLKTGDGHSKSGASQQSSSSSGGGGGDGGGAAAEEDDFFASLMAEIEEEKKPKKKEGTGSSLYVDDFFASLDANSNNEDKDQPKRDSLFDEDDLFDSFDIVEGKDEKTDDFFKTLDSELRLSADDDGDDFFASLEKELGSPNAKSELSSDTDDDFFASLEGELGSALESEKKKVRSLEVDDDADDFFVSLGETLSSEVDEGSPETYDNTVEDSKPQEVTSSKGGAKAIEAPVDLSKLTVPKLKEMLRERGMKVSGKKSELIERLRD